jgi:hypothetical protein
MISFSTGKLRKKNCFGPIRSLFSFFYCSNRKKLVKTSNESLLVLSCTQPKYCF